MKVLIFLHGTLIMHSSGRNKSRIHRVRQSIRRDSSVLDYRGYIPIGKAVSKLKIWKNQGASIIYLSSHENYSDVKKDREALKRHKFPSGRIYFRKDGISYKDIVEKILPDVLIEDDCESIGGRKEMTITNVKPAMKKKIKSIVVKEFSGIDNIPDDIKKLHLTA